MLDIGKQCRLKSDATECGVLSLTGSALFEFRTGIAIRINMVTIRMISEGVRFEITILTIYLDT